MDKEKIKQLKKYKYHSNRTYVLLQHECMVVRGESYHNIRDASKKSMILFLNHFNKYRQNMNEYKATFLCRDTSLLIHEESIDANNLYAAKDKARKIGQDLKIKNFILKVHAVKEKSGKWS